MPKKTNCVIVADFENKYQLDHFTFPKYYENFLDYILIPQGCINDRIEKIAYDIIKTYDDTPFIPVCILKGSFKFFNQLLLTFHNYSISHDRCYPITMEFVRAISYQDTESTGYVRLIGLDNQEHFHNKVTLSSPQFAFRSRRHLRPKTAHILIVEDIVDSGQTLTKVLEAFRAFEPKSLRVASLFHKRNPNSVQSHDVDFVGFSIPDKFVVGYGLDYNQYFRDLNHLCVLNEAGINHFKHIAPEEENNGIIN